MSTDGIESKEIETLREAIDNVDEKLLDLLAERKKLSLEAARVKFEEKTTLRDQRREQQLLGSRVEAGKSRSLDSHYVTRLFHEILDDSIRNQQHFLQKQANEGDEPSIKKVSFQGSQGSFGYLAAAKHFERTAESVAYVGFGSYREAMESVERGESDYAILPIENTTSGGINEVYDILHRTRLSIVGEEKLDVLPCLLALEGADLGSLSKVYSHPELVMQCSQFLAETGVSVENAFNPEQAAARIRKTGDTSAAVIASEAAAELLGLQVLKRGVANQKDNFTRFLVVARKPVKVDPRVPCKTSIVMVTGQRPGALVEALQVFQQNGINLTKLESRPVVGNPWEEMFYVDLEGNVADVRVEQTFDELTRITRFMKILGSYPSEDVQQTAVPEQPKGDEKKIARAAKPGGKAPKASKGYKLASREHKEEDTVIEIKGVQLGGDSFTVIAGPCSVESREQIMSCAQHAKKCGAKILRGGCFKPRTSPYSFQGMGYEGLELLVQAGREYGLPVVTEVMAVEDVHRVAEYTDIIQIGARNMQNFNLLQEIGRTQRPVMLKRGMSSSIEDLLHAAEYILSQGNQQVFLCERGIRTFETATRNTLDLSAVPVLRQRTHLPIIVDPSHAAGTRELVVPLAYGAKAVGAHGIMVEFHPEPEKALSDGPQALLYPQFEEMMQELL